MNDIILSLTAHENIDCLYDLIDNIKKCFIHYNILILLSLTNQLEIIFNKSKYNFVKIITVCSDNLKVWGHINLFQKHILNIKYLCNNNIKYDFFWFVSSNEMFIKIIPPDFINNNIFKIISTKDTKDNVSYDIYYNNLLQNKHHPWQWINECKKDTNFMNYLYKNKFEIFYDSHEGLVLPYDIILEIYNEYTTNYLFDNSTFKNYTMEEIFIFTYILNKYNIDRPIQKFCFIYKYKLGLNVDYSIIQKNLLNLHLSIKPVPRDYNNYMRKIIRNII